MHLMFHGQTLVKVTPEKLKFITEKNKNESTARISYSSWRYSVKGFIFACQSCKESNPSFIDVFRQ